MGIRELEERNVMACAPLRSVDPQHLLPIGPVWPCVDFRCGRGRDPSLLPCEWTRSSLVMAGNCLANNRIASRNHLVKSISREKSFPLDRGSETVPSVACPDPDGQGARNEYQEVREIGQSPAGTLEATAASVHRTYLLQALWESLSGPRPF